MVELVSVSPYAFTNPTSGSRPRALRTNGSATFDPAVSQVPQRRKLDRFAFEHRDDAVQHCRHHRRRRHTFVADQVNPGVRIEVAQIHHLSARVEIRQRSPDPGDVIRRHADQRGVVRIRGVELDGAGDVAGQIVVRELDGFGP